MILSVFSVQITVIRVARATMLLTFLSLSKICNFVNGNHNLRNISEGEEVLKSRQISAIGCTKKTGKAREILKTMSNTMECERDSFSDLGGTKETH